MTRKIVLVGIAAAVVLAGCGWLPTQEPIPVDVNDVIQLLDGDTALSDAGYDFGPVNPDADPVTATLSVQNAGDEAVTVSQATVDNDVFALGTTSFTVEPGQSADLSATFDPVASGEETGTVTITVEGFEDDPLSFTLTGEGNYPPVAYAVVEVSGAGTAEANGTYRRTAPQFSDFQDPPYMIPLYQSPTTGYYVWGQTSEVFEWFIDDNTTENGGDPDGWLYNHYVPETPIAPFGKPDTDVQWSTGFDGTAPAPTVVSELSGYVDPSRVAVGETVAAEYEFADAEDDADASTYQWYRIDDLSGVDMTDPTTFLSSLTTIDGATDASYTVAPADSGAYLVVEVTPVAETGVTEGGTSVFLGPSPSVFTP